MVKNEKNYHNDFVILSLMLLQKPLNKKNLLEFIAYIKQKKFLRQLEIPFL